MNSLRFGFLLDEWHRKTDEEKRKIMSYKTLFKIYISTFYILVENQYISRFIHSFGMPFHFTYFDCREIIEQNENLLFKN